MIVGVAVVVYWNTKSNIVLKNQCKIMSARIISARGACHALCSQHTTITNTYEN